MAIFPNYKDNFEAVTATPTTIAHKSMGFDPTVINFVTILLLATTCLTK